MNFNLGYRKQQQPIGLTNESRKNVNRVILFTNARDENNIREWAAHHLLLGFDLIYIYDHKSKPPLITKFKTAEINKKVKIMRCNLDNPVKIPLMRRSAKIANISGADWMLYLDADEFLVLNAFKNVKQMLKTFFYADMLSINWLMFGTNNHINNPKGLLIDNYTKSELRLDVHVKSFVRPSQVVSVNNPHYYNIFDEDRGITINNRVMDKPYSLNHTNCVEYYNSHAFIAHYVYQSEETYIKRKVKLPTDDTNIFRGMDKTIHERYNSVDNFVLKKRYSERVREMMQRTLLYIPSHFSELKTEAKEEQAKEEEENKDIGSHEIELEITEIQKNKY
jgi:hypothetical protein